MGEWPDKIRLYRTEKEAREYRELKERLGLSEYWPQGEYAGNKEPKPLPGGDLTANDTG